MVSNSKILLVKTFIKKSFNAQNMYPPPGLGYLAEVLDRNGVDYDVMNMGLGYSIKQLFGKIRQYKPTHLGISVYTYQHKSVYSLLENIKSIFPSLSIIAGGPHVSTLREKVLQDCESIDFGVTLEGEITLIQLLEGKKPKDIKGLIYRENSKVVSTGDRDFIDDLDGIGFPKYRKFALEQYSALPKLMTIITSRGCPYKCIYCPVQTTIGRKLRLRSPENIIDEIRYWYNQGYRIIEIMDDNFTFDKKRVHEICDLIEKENFTGIVFNIPNGVRADKVDYELLKKLKRVGFYTISFGVEAGNNKILKNLKKGEKIETIIQAIEWAIDIGLNIRLFFLIGSPGETYEDFKDSLRIAQQYPVDCVCFYNLIPMPKTELFEWVSGNNYFLKQPDYYLNNVAHYNNEPLFETPEMGVAERRKAYRIAKHVEKKVYRKTIKRKLSKFGVFAGILAFVYSTVLVQTMLRKNTSFRRFVSTLKIKTKM